MRMLVSEILYHPRFLQRFEKLPVNLQERTVKAESLFRSNSLHSSLRLHRLRGNLKDYWSISVTMQIRIVFKQSENGEIMFLTVGNHDIYR